MASTPTDLETPQAEPDASRTQVIFKRTLLVWLSIVVLLFCWQNLFYLGLVERAAEWQFSRVGSYYPALTLAVFVFLFGAPILYIFSRRANRSVETAESGLIEAKRFLAVLTGVAIIFAVAAAISACLGLAVRNDKAAPVALDARSVGAPQTGFTTLTGNILYDRRVTMGTSVLMTSRADTFAPVIAQKSAPIRYFAQIDGTTTAPSVASLTGMLRKNALRGDALQLFQDAGYQVADPYYVLFTSERTARAPYYISAAQFAIVALVLALAALYQRRRIRRASPGLRRGTPHAVG